MRSEKHFQFKATLHVLQAFYYRFDTTIFKINFTIIHVCFAIHYFSRVLYYIIFNTREYYLSVGFAFLTLIFNDSFYEVPDFFTKGFYKEKVSY